MTKNSDSYGRKASNPSRQEPLEARLLLLQRALDESPVVILITDRTGRIEYVNAAVTAITGYETGEVIGKNPALFRWPETKPEIYASMWQTILAGENWSGEILNRKRNGESYWASLSISPVRSDGGVITHFIGIQEEITERKLNQESTHASEQRFRHLIEAIPSGVVIADMDQRLDLVNRAFCEIVGLSREEAKGLDLREIVHPGDLPHLEEETRRRRAGHISSYHLRIVRGDGEVREIEMSASPLIGKDGSIREAVGILDDVTEQRRLQARAQALARFPKQNPNPVLRVDRSGEVLFANDASRELTPLFPPQSRDRVTEAWRSRLEQVYLAGRQESFEIEAGPRVFHTTICPTPNEDYVTLYALDITATHQAMAEASLARERALEASRVKSEFLANMSHELRTPLNGVLGLAELLASTRLDDEQRAYVDDLLLSGRRLFELIGDVLDFSRIELGRLELARTEFSLRELLEESRRMHAPHAAKLGLDLLFAVRHGGECKLLGDPKRIRQILDNLLSNALRFTPQGGVTVEARCDADGPGKTVLTLVVSDTGIGIPPEQVDSIFDSFTQVDGSMTRSYEGSGLGLAICAALVREFGGDIQVTSEVGKGSRFTVVLPLALAGSDASGEQAPTGPVLIREDAAPAHSLPARGLRILLAEDNRVNQLVARRLLEKQGHTVAVVGDGAQAIEMIGKERFDVILMDIQMPVLDGLTATRRIRRMESRSGRRVPIIALTAHAVERDRARCLAAGMDEYLSKPIRTGELNAALERISGERRPAPTRP